MIFTSYLAYEMMEMDSDDEEAKNDFSNDSFGMQPSQQPKMKSMPKFKTQIPKLNMQKAQNLQKTLIKNKQLEKFATFGVNQDLIDKIKDLQKDIETT